MRRVATLIAIIHATAPTSLVRGDALDELRQRGALVWGGDQEGGGPYVYPDPNDPNRVVGFEVDLADALAAKLGTTAKFFQADWNTLPEFLRAGKIDVILNGYEWSAARAAQMRATRPYYLYELQLLARASDDSILGWEDLRTRAGRRRSVSVLSGSAALTYLRVHWAGDVDIVDYNGNTDAMMQVRNRVHDATLPDLPVALFYRHRPQGQGLKFVGPPVGRGAYVMFVRPEEARLTAALDQAIEALYRDGMLRRIYEKYGIWNGTQATLLETRADAAAKSDGPQGNPGDAGDSTAAVAPEEQAPRGWQVVRNYSGILLKSAGMTFLLSVLSMPIAILIGLLVALGRIYGPAWLRLLLAIYVEVLRGTPVMLQLYVIYFLLPEILPVRLDAMVAAVAGLAINYSAYEAEIYRAGLQAIPRGQMEAALALGLSRGAALRYVIVPQAVRIVVPPVTNDFIALFKDTSICSVIAVTELTKQYNVLANSSGAIVELAGLTALLYLAMSYPLSVAARRLERRMAETATPVPTI